MHPLDLVVVTKEDDGDSTCSCSANELNQRIETEFDENVSDCDSQATEVSRTSTNTTASTNCESPSCSIKIRKNRRINIRKNWRRGARQKILHPTEEDQLHDREPVLLLGVDIGHLSRRAQFLLCATGVFVFSLFYGYWQELIAVRICDRQLGLFLAVAQFSGYTLWSYIFRTYVLKKQKKYEEKKSLSTNNGAALIGTVPFVTYLGLSILRAIDLAMTNLAMQYVNYPAKTLMKSSRVVFTMLFGVILARKRYQLLDYAIILLMVAGLVIFMHADATSSAVFDSMGIIMLTVSLIADGALSNLSEIVMRNYGIGQDEFIYRMYSIALLAITGAAAFKGDLSEGMSFLAQPGSYSELDLPHEERTWSVIGKVVVIFLFSTTGFFGSSCAAAITKNFGALTMSITSTARKATTIFISFALFDNECTVEHIAGIIIFMTSLVWKSLCKENIRNKRNKSLVSREFVKTPSSKSGNIV